MPWGTTPTPLANGGEPSRALAPMGFQGRREQLAELEAALSESLRQGPVAVVVQGESGIGKSALCAQFVQAHPEVLVLSGRCYEKGAVQFNALDGAMEALGRHLVERGAGGKPTLPAGELALLSTAFPVLQKGAEPALLEQSDPEKLGGAICAALSATFSVIAAERPLVLWVDDLQWADADSLSLLSELLRPGSGLPLLFIGTQRARPGGEHAELQTLAARLTRALRGVQLGPLNHAEADVLVKMLKPALTPEAREQIIHEGRGHPLYLQELVLRDEAGPVQLEELLRGRVAGLTARGRQLIELLSVAGAPVRDTTLAAAIDAGGPELRALVDELRRKKLLHWSGPRSEGRLDTWHDRVREAVLAKLPEAQRKLHHEALARAYEREGAAEVAPERVLQHFLGAGQLGRASELALAAADKARAALAFDRAAELYKVALECGEATGDNERALRLAYADCAALAGRGDEAAQACIAAKTGAAPEVRIELQRQAAEHLLGSGHFERGLETMRAVLDEIGEDWPKNPAALIASIALGRLRVRMRGYTWQRRVATPRDLLRLRAYRAVGVGLLNISPMLAAVFHSRYVLLALECGPAECTAEALAMEAMYQSLFGGTVHLPLLASARAIAKEVGPERETRYAVDAGGGLVRIQDGDLRGGVDELKVALDGWRRADRSPWLINRGVLGLLHALERLGALGELGPSLDETLRSCAHRGDRLVEETATRAACSVWLARGEADALRRRLAVTPWVPSEGGFSATMFLDLYARAGLSLYGGGREGWAELSDAMHDYARSFLSRTTLYRADYLWLRGRLGLAEGSEAALEEALLCSKELLKNPRPHHVVWGRLLEAAVVARGGEKERATALLQTVAEAAPSLSMDLYARVAARRQGEMIGGPEGASVMAAATEWMARNGVVDPARFTDFIAPGFPRR